MLCLTSFDGQSYDLLDFSMRTKLQSLISSDHLSTFSLTTKRDISFIFWKLVNKQKKEPPAPTQKLMKIRESEMIYKDPTTRCVYI